MNTEATRNYASSYLEALQVLRSAREYPAVIPDIGKLNAAIRSELGPRGLERVKEIAWRRFAPAVGWDRRYTTTDLREASGHVEHSQEEGHKAGVVRGQPRCQVPLVSEAT